MQQHVAFFVLQFLASAFTASAQESVADIWVYGTDQCSDDPFSTSLNLNILKGVSEITVDSNGKKNGACTKTSLSSDFSKTGGVYDVWVDENTIPDGCELVLYNGAETDDQLNEGACSNFYRRVRSDAKCVQATLPPRFGYAMCCGDEACKVAAELPEISNKKRTDSTVRDVTAIKRASPLERLSRRKDCSFDSEGKESKLTYGAQTRVGPSSLGCTTGQSCSQTVGFQHSTSITNSFGVETSFGGELFKVISASVSFSYEYSEEKSKTYSMEYTVSMPENADGYLTFQQKLECTPSGKFSGDCDWDASDEGTVCIPVYVGGLPDGKYQYVQTN